MGVAVAGWWWPLYPKHGGRTRRSTVAAAGLFRCGPAGRPASFPASASAFHFGRQSQDDLADWMLRLTRISCFARSAQAARLLPPAFHSRLYTKKANMSEPTVAGTHLDEVTGETVSKQCVQALFCSFLFFPCTFFLTIDPPESSSGARPSVTRRRERPPLPQPHLSRPHPPSRSPPPARKMT
jgi:hypothetical protein